MRKPYNDSSPSKTYDPWLHIYLKELRKTPLLTSEEERDLLNKISHGDKEAEQMVVQANLRLVVFIAKKFSSHGVSLADLIQEGNIGLCKAVKKFDVSKRCRFSTYAVWWIRQAIWRALGERVDAIRLPAYKRHEIKRLQNIRVGLEQVLERPARAHEIGSVMQKSPNIIDALLCQGQPVISLEGLMPDILENIEDPPITAQEEYPIPCDWEVYFRCLSPREREVIELRFMQGYPLRKTAEKMNLCGERVRQIQMAALAKLREIIGEMPFGKQTAPRKRRKVVV